MILVTIIKWLSFRDCRSEGLILVLFSKDIKNLTEKLIGRSIIGVNMGSSKHKGRSNHVESKVAFSI